MNGDEDMKGEAYGLVPGRVAFGIIVLVLVLGGYSWSCREPASRVGLLLPTGLTAQSVALLDATTVEPEDLLVLYIKEKIPNLLYRIDWCLFNDKNDRKCSSAFWEFTFMRKSLRVPANVPMQQCRAFHRKSVSLLRRGRHTAWLAQRYAYFKRLGCSPTRCVLVTDLTHWRWAQLCGNLAVKPDKVAMPPSIVYSQMLWLRSHKWLLHTPPSFSYITTNLITQYDLRDAKRFYDYYNRDGMSF